MKWRKIAGIAKVLDTPDTLYVFCTGSIGRGDWIRNMRTRRVDYGGHRVNEADFSEAVAVLLEIEGKIGTREIVIGGFSRGGAVAAILHLLLAEEYGTGAQLKLWAPKRSGLPVIGRAHRGDMVPYLPPWYPRIDLLTEDEPITWPWAAHKKSAHDAARWRHEAENEAG
jgi:hypothetical protein